MKVSALQQFALPLQRLPIAVAEPSRPFHTLLEEAPAGEGDGAKAFCEGGLLGEADSPDAAASGITAHVAQPLGRPDTPEAFHLSEVATEASLQGAVGLITLNAAPGPHTETRDILEAPVRPNHRAANMGDVSILAEVRMRVAVGDHSAAPRRSRPSTPTPTPIRPKANLTLTKTEGGSLQVIAAAPGLDREAANRLRKLMSDVAAQFGLDLAALQLNGLQIEKPFIGSTGGPHGR